MDTTSRKKEHWDSQIRTHYKDLSEHEKEMDRKEVRTYLPFIRSLLAATTARAEKKGYFEGYDFAREEIKIAALIADDKRKSLK